MKYVMHVMLRGGSPITVVLPTQEPPPALQALVTNIRACGFFLNEAVYIVHDEIAAIGLTAVTDENDMAQTQAAPFQPRMQ